MFNKLREKFEGFLEGEKELDIEPKESLGTKVKKKVKRRAEIKEKDVEELLENLRLSLLSADVSLDTTEQITGEIREDLVGKQLTAKDSLKEITTQAIRKTLKKRLNEPREYLHEAIEESKQLYTVLFLGPNGHGKTTTMAKFSHMLQERGIETVLAAADTFRAASIEQLEKWSEELDTRLIKHEYGSDPAAVCYDAKEHAKTQGKGAVLIDTAGRSELDKNLMQQLEKIKRVTEPDYTIYVTESVAGNAAVEQAREFDDKIGIDGLILTKTDTDAKGGSLLSISNELNKPIHYVGTGQELEDLKKFKKQWFINKIVPE